MGYAIEVKACFTKSGEETINTKISFQKSVLLCIVLVYCS